MERRSHHQWDVDIRGAGAGGRELIERLCLQGAARLLKAALEIEVDRYIAANAEARDHHGRALVVRNGRSRPRRVWLGDRPVEIEFPRVNDKRRDSQGRRLRFQSQILPPYHRRPSRITDLLPVVYLASLASGDFHGAVSEIVGDDVPDQVASPFETAWENEYRRLCGLPVSISAQSASLWLGGAQLRRRQETGATWTVVFVAVSSEALSKSAAVQRSEDSEPEFERAIG